MLDAERLIYLLLQRGLPDVTIAPDLDVDSIDAFPMLTFTITGGNALAASPGKPTAWEATLALSVFDNDLDAAIALAERAYDLVWSWDNPWGTAHAVDGLGHAAEIDDQSMFTRTMTVEIDSRIVTQLSGEFTLQVHQA